MRRRVFNFVAVLSLLMCGGMVGLWVRSYWRSDVLRLETAKYVYDQQESDSLGKVYRAVIVERRFSVNRGGLEFSILRSVDDNLLLLGKENVMDWSEYYPPGTHCLWESGAASSRVRHFALVSDLGLWNISADLVVNPNIALDRCGFFIGSCSVGVKTTFDYKTLPIWATRQEALMPMWVLVLLVGILPALRFRRWVRSMAARAGNACGTCGYDLTGNTSGVCPECGAEATKTVDG